MSTLTVNIDEGSEFFYALSDWLEAVRKSKGGLDPRTELGAIGEFVVWVALNHRNARPAPLDATTWYDQGGDGRMGIGEDTVYEVKTIMPWYEELGMPVPPNQIRKLTEAHRVFFVEVPYPYTADIKVWELPRETREDYYLKTNPRGDSRAIYKFTKLRPYVTFTNYMLAKRMQELSPSKTTT